MELLPYQARRGQPQVMAMPDKLCAHRAELHQLVHDLANEIHDPCGLAYGHRIGLAEMGLIRRCDVVPTDAGWHIELTLRLTAPNCLYFFYFERELRRRLQAVDRVTGVAIQWDHVYDWTPDELAPSVRVKLHGARAEILARHEDRRRE